MIPFPEGDPAIVKEYLYIKKVLFKGDGESACMAVVRHSKDILASSTLRDIKQYCDLHSIMYLTTMDFLCHALSQGMFDMARCNAFIKRVLDNKNKMPVQRMEEFIAGPYPPI